MITPTIRHLVPVALVLGFASAAPQFAYSTTTFQHPYVPIPFARAPYQDDYFNNQIDRSPQDASAPAQLPPSPYHFLPATLPQAIYSEPTHILSGYSYQTLDPAGAKSQVLFVSGPNSQQLFRQNADLLHIVLPALFTAGGDNAIPGTGSEQELDTSKIPEREPTTGAAETSAEKDEFEVPKGSTESDNDGSIVESKTQEEDKSDKTDDNNANEPTNNSEEDDSSKEESDKSSEEAGLSDKSDELKADVSASEASNTLKTVPPESDSLESASTEAPITSEKNASDDKKSDEKKSDEFKSDEKSNDEKPSQEKSSEGKLGEDDSTTESSVTSTTVVGAE